MFWNLAIDFEDINYLNNEWDSSLAIEWLTLPEGNRNLPLILNFSSNHSPDAEASFYLAEHHLIDTWECSIKFSSDLNIEAEYSAKFDFPGLNHDPVPGIEISGTVQLRFDGVIVLRDNIFPKPSTVDEAKNMVCEFLNINNWQDVSEDDWRFVFVPPGYDDQ